MVLFVPVSNSPFETNGIGSNNLVTGDFNNDNHLDIAIGNYNSDNISMFLGDGNGEFTNPLLFEIPNISFLDRLDTADFNLDGNLDLVVTNFPSRNNNNYSILLGDGAGSFDTINNFDVGIITQDVTTGDFNQDGIPDLAFALDTVGGKVRIRLGNGNVLR